MDLLPNEIEKIILKYKNDLDIHFNHKKKYQKCLDDICKMIYIITKKNSNTMTSHRIINSKNSSYIFSKSSQQLFYWTGFSTF